MRDNDGIMTKIFREATTTTGSILVICHHDHRFILLPDFLPVCYKIYLNKKFPLFSLSILVYLFYAFCHWNFRHIWHGVVFTCMPRKMGNDHDRNGDDDDEKARVKINLDT